MNWKEFIVFCLNWIAVNSAALVDVLAVLSQVLVVGVAGLALYVVARSAPKGRDR